MNKAVSALYALANENIAITPEYQNQIRAFAKAKLAILEELELLSGKTLLFCWTPTHHWMANGKRCMRK